MDVFKSFRATWPSVLIDSHRNSIVRDLFRVLCGKALVNSHLLFGVVKQTLSEFCFNELQSFVIYWKGGQTIWERVQFAFVFQ